MRNGGRKHEDQARGCGSHDWHAQGSVGGLPQTDCPKHRCLRCRGALAQSQLPFEAWSSLTQLLIQARARP